MVFREMLAGQDARNQNRRSAIIVAAFVAVLAAAPYLQTWRYDFVGFDDPLYVIENPHVEHGLNLTNIAWAFTTFRTGNWHPLTWLSHLLDANLWRANAGGHHLTSVFLHGVNSVLLFFVLLQMTGRMWRCALVAVLFAVHPLHVESVAWISERKDVLSTLLGLLALWAYVAYAREGSIRRYLVVLILFTLSLMAKAMWVTFPFLLLLLDIWPLQRWKLWPIESSISNQLELQPAKTRRVILEKIPLLAIAAVFSVIAVLAQGEGQAVVKISDFPIGARISNAIVGYTLYIVKLVVPLKLAFLYPLREYSLTTVVCSGLFLVIVTVMAFTYRNRYPALLIGWLWFLGALVPVIGLVQIGWQAIADRYSYLPSVGFFIMIAWSIPAELPSFYRRISIAIASVFIALLIAKTWRQVSYWKDSLTLYTHAVQVTNGNFLVHQFLGGGFEKQGKFAEALRFYRIAAAERPHFARTTVHEKIANVLIRQQRYTEAIDELETAIAINPDSSPVYNSMGSALMIRGRDDKAATYLHRAVELDPKNVAARINYGMALVKLSRWNEAIAQLTPVVRAEPNRLLARTYLAVALANRGKLDQAINELREVLRIDPKQATAQEVLQQIEAQTIAH